MKLGHFFIDRPIYACVVSIFIVLLGLVAYTNLPVAQYPEIAPPTVVIRATYPGANAETVAQTVAAPLEEQINGVEDMLYMSSMSSGDGTMALTITFAAGTDLDQAQVLVQNRVAIAEPRLPEEVRRLGVTALKASPDLMMAVHMYASGDAYDQLYISNFARNNVRDALLRLDGVGDLRISGERMYALRVWLDPQRMATFGLTSNDVVAAVRSQNVQVSSGTLGQQPSPTGTAFQVSVNTQGRFSDVDEFRDVIVHTTPDGRVVRVGDVAGVELGAQDYNTSTFVNGERAVGILIFQRPGSNALETAAEVRAVMEGIAPTLPEGLEYEILFNPMEFIEESVNAVYTTLIEAVFLVVIVILVFLQSWRSALIPIIAIPVSLIGTMAIMAALGFSLNTLTLFGFVLAIGVVVDDAIVVIENIERNIALGLSPKEAARKTMDEVGSAVVAIALVLGAVFIPTAFIPGITGQFYRQFALTIAISTTISAFVSLTLTPALGARLLKPHAPHSGKGRFSFLRRAAGGFNSGFDRASESYATGIGRLVKRKLIVFPIYGGLMFTTVFTAQSVPTGFIPSMDQGYLISAVQLPEGATLERTEAAVRRVIEIARETPGVANAIANVGTSGTTSTTATNAATVFVLLEPFDTRRAADGNLSSAAIRLELLRRYQAVQEAFVAVISPASVRGMGNSGGFRMMVRESMGTEIERVLEAGRTLAATASSGDVVNNVFTSFSASSPQIYLDIDRVKAEMLGVPVEAIFATLQQNLGSAYVNDFDAMGRIYQVRAQAEQSFRLEPRDIEQLRVRSTNGALVPLGSVLSVSETMGPNLIQRYNMMTAVPVQGTAAEGVSSGAALDEMERLAAEILPQGIDFEWTDLAYQQTNAGSATIFLVLSVLCVFLVLAALYESWTLPLSILLIVPMAILSALLGIMLHGLDNNILTQVGLVVLVGLAAKNAILIVEFARDAERTGSTPVEAAVMACRIRLRPILMTALAFIMGVVPLVIATGPGAEMRNAIGIAVFYGMAGVTVFGLIFTPVFYVAVRQVETWVARASFFGRAKYPQPAE